MLFINIKIIKCRIIKKKKLNISPQKDMHVLVLILNHVLILKINIKLITFVILIFQINTLINIRFPLVTNKPIQTREQCHQRERKLVN